MTSTNGKTGPRLFQKGNPGGPGNPFAARVAEYRKALWDAVSIDDFQAIVRRLVMLAQAGDVGAAKLIIERTAGKPIETVDDAGGVLDMARMLRAFVEAGRDAAQGDPNAKIEAPKTDDEDQA